MSIENVTLDRIELKEEAKAARVEYMQRHGRVALEVAGSPLRTHRVIAIAAMLIISFGVKMFFLSPPTAEATIRAIPNAGVNVLQMHRDVDTKSLPVQKMNDRTFIFTE